MQKIITLFILSFALIACSIEDIDQKQTPTSTTAHLHFHSLPSGIEYAFEGEEYGFYRLHLRLPTEVSEVTLEDQQGTKFVHTRQPKAPLIFPQGHQIRIYSPQNSHSFSLKHQETIQAPQDLLIAQPKVLEGPTHLRAHRIIFTNNGSISTYGHELTLEAQEIVTPEAPLSGVLRSQSHHFHIQAFPSDFKITQAQTPYRFPKPITIQSRILRGVLAVEISGADGMAGTKGEDGIFTASLNGHPSMGFQPHVPRGEAPSSCISKNGGDGKKGNPGKNGGNGSDGGNTAPLKIKIASFNSAQLFVYQSPGLGGAEGKKGIGSAGGQPGPRGPGICSGNPGKKHGPKGDDGLDGLRGSTGKTEPLQISTPDDQYIILPSQKHEQKQDLLYRNHSHGRHTST